MNFLHPISPKITLPCRLLILLFVALTFGSGCAAVALSGATMGAGYTFMNTADKTSNFSLDHVHVAMTIALDRMDIEVLEDVATEDGREIEANAKNLSIDIELQSITSRTTKISVNASKETFIKDRATAIEIIEQTQIILEATQNVSDKGWRHVIQNCSSSHRNCRMTET